MTLIMRCSALALLISASGCSQLTSIDARKEAAERWKLARAQVKTRLAADQLAAGHIRDAAGEIAEAQRLDPDNPRLTLMQARVALARGDAGAAQKSLDEVLNRQPDDVSGVLRAEAHYLAGIVAQQRLRWDEALEEFVRASEADTSDVAYVVAVAQALLQLGRVDDALDSLLAREEQLGHTNAFHATLAECFEQRGDWTEAAAAWRQVSGSATDEGVQERLAGALFHARRYGEAVGILEALVDAPIEGDDDVAAKRRVNQRILLAECLIEEGQFDEARTQAGLAAHASPRNTAASMLLARIHTELRRYPDALEAVERTLRAEPRHRAALELGAALAFRLGNRARACTLATRLIALDGEVDNPIARQILARSRITEQGKVGLATPVQVERSE